MSKQKLVAIKSIEEIDMSFDKYDIEVENVSNFFANNILVHNCRFTLVHRGDELYGLNRRGKKVAVPNEIAEEVKNWFGDYSVDGELIGNVLYLFDALDINSNITSQPFLTRYDMLEDFYNRYSGDSAYIKLVPVAKTTTQKQKMFDDLKANKAEGIVFKRSAAKYTTGRPASGGNYLKCKFWASASCIVSKINTTKRSVEVSLMNGNKLVPAGNVTIYPNFDMPKLDDIIEVKYLYATSASILYQPIHLGVRDDIAAKDCVISQLKYKQTVDEDEEQAIVPKPPEKKLDISDIKISDKTKRYLDLD